MKAEERFPIMGSRGHIIVRATHDPERLVQLGQQRASELEALWSRFIPTSEISVLNASAGTPVSVSPETRTLVRRSIQAWEHTDGLFDPLQLNRLLDLGYDRTFSDLHITSAPSDLEPMVTIETSPDASECGSIVIDEAAGTVTLPAGASFDPGGIGKGLAADLIAEELMADGPHGVHGVLVNLGGDLRALGEGPGDDEEAWVIDIADDIAKGHQSQIALRSGAVATSTTRRRQWKRPDGSNGNHLVDPVTGDCVQNDVVLVSVLAAEAWQAEVLATALAVAGPNQLDETAIIRLLGNGTALLSTDTATTTYGPLAPSIRKFEVTR